MLGRWDVGRVGSHLLLSWIANAESFDAFEKVDEMVRLKPEEAWRLIRDMIDIAPDGLLGIIAAGPLENLLHEHGKAFISRVTKAAATDSRFQRCLSGVWLFEPKRLAEQIRRAATSPTKKGRRYSGRISKKRAHSIARWFYHSETAWTHSRLDELIRTDLDAAWRIILLLIRIAIEDQHDVLDEIDALAFDKLVRLRGPETYDRIVEEARSNATIKQWVELRKRYKNPDEEWRGLLERYKETPSR